MQDYRRTWPDNSTSLPLTQSHFILPPRGINYARNTEQLSCPFYGVGHLSEGLREDREKRDAIQEREAQEKGRAMPPNASQR
jgi:hypothetical protein